ncbi:hypothetical protein HNY73_009546 [Argiope bruennichi]|uniref:DNA2/NAM7 helicase helicase domain-containing protein n=1 Tax=Argiope bruennichi TaxID=94029 RepID=A0A8T0F9Z8_ARGBR|nr:hypothetical protein HNY73_009546 [Argiope bruennichi]
MSEIGGEIHQVRNNYAHHLMYYNTYFPFLLFECFNKISLALKEAKTKEEEIGKNIYKIVDFEKKTSYVSFTCHSFISCSDMDSIPRDGHIILIKFDSNLKSKSDSMLGYVCSSATRAYSHKFDYNHEMLEYVSVNTRTDLRKVRIIFFTVFDISEINRNTPIRISKLTNVKKTLMLNDALSELQRSPLCNVILNPQSHNIKSIVLPRKQDTDAMTTIVQAIVNPLNISSPQMAIVVSGPFTDSLSAIVQVVEDIKKSKIPGKILVCVRAEMLSQMGMGLIETSNNLLIINREKEFLHNKLQGRVLDEMIPFMPNAQNRQNDEAKRKVLQEAEVLLTVTGTCFYKDVQDMVRDLSYCIIHDAHNFTEPESLLPLLYGIKHLILFGDPNEPCHASSKCAASFGYKSLFHRVCNSC